MKSKCRSYLWVYVSELPEDIVLCPVVPKERNDEIEGCGSLRVRQEKYFAWELLREITEKELGLGFEELNLVKDGNGKWICDKFFFSISHSDGLVAVAISSENVGVDIENVERYREGIERRILTKGELEGLSGLDEAQTKEYVIKKWTQKESIFKTMNERLFSPTSIECAEHPLITKDIIFQKRKYILSICSKIKKIRIYKDFK